MLSRSSALLVMHTTASAINKPASAERPRRPKILSIRAHLRLILSNLIAMTQDRPEIRPRIIYASRQVRDNRKNVAELQCWKTLPTRATFFPRYAFRGVK